MLRRLGLGVLQDFIKLRMDSQAKNIAAWTPVIAEILQGFTKFDDKAEFFRNNRGINDGNDLPEDLLGAIYDNINSQEIRMKDEIEAAPVPVATAPGLANALANVGRDLQKEAYMMQSNSMANKTEVRVAEQFHLSQYSLRT